MAILDDIKLLIQTIADGVDDNGALGLKTPGDPIDLGQNVEIRPGESWGPTKAFEIYLGGISQYLNSSGISEVAAIKAKVNELVGAYNQLRTDYNDETVPTTAESVDPIP